MCVCACAGNREWPVPPESCLEPGAGLPVQTNAERTGSTHPAVTLALHLGVCFLQFFGQTKPIVHLILIFFLSLFKGNTERTEQIHVLFVCCLKCMPGRKALFCQLCEGQKYTTTFSCAEGRTLSVSIQGLHRGCRCIVRHGTCFPDSNINSFFFFFCVLFTVRRNQIFPNGPL